MSESRILVVEDDALIRRAYERVLVAAHAVTSVGSGHEALVELGRASFHAIVSDIDMPGITGIELLKTVKSTTDDVPVLLVTGCPSLESAKEAVNLGAFCYLTKPVAPSDLLAAVARATRAHADGRTSCPQVPSAGEATLEGRFERALEGMYMAFQPIVSVTERRVLGYEALLRTTEKSLLRPPDLIAAAERLGRLRELSRRARRTVASAIPSAPDDARIFINLHATDLTDDELVSATSALAPYAHRVVLEITERASLDEVDDLSTYVDALRRRGYWLAIDDLGAGYAGLTSVSRLEPEVVKLDISLVRVIDQSRTKRQLVQSMAKVCRELGMTVVTEGVETAAERDALLGLGCDVLQGYLYGRPSRGFELPQIVPEEAA